MTWSEWRPITEPCLHQAPAIYELRIANSGEPIAVPRFLGTDHRGLISIGQTGSMSSRRWQFIRAIEKCSGHSERNLFYYLLRYSALKSVHPDHAIEYRFHPEPDKAAARALENRMIKAYIRQFGEGPPLNCAIPDRDGDWECGAGM